MVADLGSARLPEFCTAARPRLYDTLCGCAAGRELLACGWEDDIATSAAHGVSTTVRQLLDDEFRAT